METGVTKESQSTHTFVTSQSKNFTVNTPPPDSSSVAVRQTAIGRRILSRLAGADQYTVRLATSPADIRAAQSLRFMVFNLELQEHRFTDALMQAGRACVHSEHRNLRVLSMLWKGIAAYAREHGCRYMVGCSSLTSQDAEEGIALYEMLARKHLAPIEFRTLPLPEWVCPLPALEREPAPVPRAPKLLTAYLSLGAKICAPPALDREFKTIDFLTLLDLKNLPASAAELLQ